MKPVSLPAFFKTILLCLPLCSLFPCSATAQFLWEKVYNLDFSATAYSAVETDDHNFLVTGRALSNDSFQLLLMKVAPNGDLLWHKRLAGVAGEHSRIIARTADQNFMIVGSSVQYMILLKINADGEPLWKRYVRKDRAGICLDLTADGGVIALGSYTTPLNGELISYVFAAKFDSLGNEQWSNTYFQQADAWPEAIEQTPDGGYIIGGTHAANSTGGGFLLKLTGAGAVSWFRTYKNPGMHKDYFRFAATTNDGGFVLCGWENSILLPPMQQNPDAYIIRTNASGIQTDYYLVGVANSVELANHIFQNASNQFILTGETDEPGDNKNVLLALVSPTGATQKKCFFGTPDFDRGQSALETTDHSILVVGHTSSATVNWRKPYLIKTNWQCSTVTSSEPGPETAGISVYPNPTGAILHVDLPPDAGVSCSVEYFDALGRLVATAALRPSGNETDVSFLAPGVYTYRVLQNKQRLKTGKIIRL
ncbi:MAG: T9SS type A sorting domain-containing protein [Saprospirales bacterium]|nr:T9SS type A sorting domain-containing protein [Saprospirales bacterium]MBK8921915.1 T9SS type A sorting domain-containing protein [Saprospirales bacterium]